MVRRGGGGGGRRGGGRGGRDGQPCGAQHAQALAGQVLLGAEGLGGKVAAGEQLCVCV